MKTQPDESTVLVDGLRLRYVEVGSGPAVLLVHGIGSTLEYWRGNMDALAEHHRVIAIDLPGSGFSERGPRVPSLSEVAGLLVHFLDALHINKVSLVGVSMGALICLEIALLYPDR